MRRRPPTRSSQRLRLAAGGITLALVLAACGDDATDAPAEEPVVEESESESEPTDDAEAVEPDPDDADATTDDEAADGGTATDGEASAADDADGEPDADGGDDAVSGGGTVIADATLVVEGVAYEVTGLRRCQEDGAFFGEVDLEYQVFAEGPDGSGQLDLFIDEFLDQVSWAGPEGVYGNVENEVDAGFAGDRAASTVTLQDARTAEGEFEVVYDLPVLPESDAVACR